MRIKVCYKFEKQIPTPFVSKTNPQSNPSYNSQILKLC
jgi:hypothetical protein